MCAISSLAFVSIFAKLSSYGRSMGYSCICVTENAVNFVLGILFAPFMNNQWMGRLWLTALPIPATSVGIAVDVCSMQPMLQLARLCILLRLQRMALQIPAVWLASIGGYSSVLMSYSRGLIIAKLWVLTSS